MALFASIDMPSISDMSSPDVSGESESPISIGVEGPDPDIPSVPDSFDSSLSVAESAEVVLEVFGKTSIITAEAEDTATVLESGEATSLMSEVSISSPSYTIPHCMA
jgi:hypothetical protein